MQIIFNKDIAEQMKDTHTVLELETFDVEGQTLHTFCVVPADKIPLAEFPQLPVYKELHGAFVAALKNKDSRLCADLAEHLKGKFGGEVDTFYEEILKRFALEQEI
jgi:hypothetical protein